MLTSVSAVRRWVAVDVVAAGGLLVFGVNWGIVIARVLK